MRFVATKNTDAESVKAVIGCIQAREMIKYIIEIGALLTNRLLVYDGLNMEFTEFKIKKAPDCEHCSHLELKG